MKPLSGLPLLGGRLGADAVDLCAEGVQLSLMVPKRARLWGAAPRAGRKDKGKKRELFHKGLPHNIGHRDS